MLRFNRFAFWLLLLSGAVLSGCGRSSPLVTVTGEVQFKGGGHVPDSNIEFRRVGGDESAIASGTVDKEGKFQLYTSEVGEGAMPGDYQVVIMPRVHGGKHAVKIDSIPEKYRRYESSPLRFHVAEDESKNDFHIQIDAPKNNKSKTSTPARKLEWVRADKS